MVRSPWPSFQLSRDYDASTINITGTASITGILNENNARKRKTQFLLKAADPDVIKFYCCVYFDSTFKARHSCVSTKIYTAKIY